MPGQLKNTNARTHGLTCRFALTNGSLPPGHSYIQKIINKFRAALERAVIDAKGEIDVNDAATINTACRLERHSQMAQKWLREEAEKLSPADRLRFSAEIGRASVERDRALRALGLGRAARSDIQPAVWRDEDFEQGDYQQDDHQAAHPAGDAHQHAHPAGDAAGGPPAASDDDDDSDVIDVGQDAARDDRGPQAANEAVDVAFEDTDAVE